MNRTTSYGGSSFVCGSMFRVAVRRPGSADGLDDMTIPYRAPAHPCLFAPMQIVRLAT